MTEIFTIGFTKKSAQAFFELVRNSGAERLVDIRLNNVSQLAGFAKQADLAYFLRELLQVEYVHDRRLAPLPQMLDDYKKKRIQWSEYEKSFIDLMDVRRIEEIFSPADLNNSVLLCSESEAGRCHRRLVAEYLAARWPATTVTHL